MYYSTSWSCPVDVCHHRLNHLSRHCHQRVKTSNCTLISCFARAQRTWFQATQSLIPPKHQNTRHRALDGTDALLVLASLPHPRGSIQSASLTAGRYSAAGALNHPAHVGRTTIHCEKQNSSRNINKANYCPVYSSSTETSERAWPIAYCASDETSPRPRPQTQIFTRSRSPGWHHRLRDSESRPATSVQPVRAPGAGNSHSLNDGGGGGMHGALAVAVAAAGEEGKSTLCHGTPASSRQRWKAAIVFEFRSCLGRGGSGRRRWRVQAGLHKPGCLALSHACISSRKPFMPLQHQSGALLCVSSARPNFPPANAVIFCRFAAGGGKSICPKTWGVPIPTARYCECLHMYHVPGMFMPFHGMNRYHFPA